MVNYMKNDKRHKGLGDTVAKLFESIGIDKIVEQFYDDPTKDDCGCKKRKEKLNQFFPYKNEKLNEE